MRVSVVIPCFNARAFLPETLASVVAQTHPDVQVIVVDDGSSDGSADYVAALGPRFRLERLAHGGAPRARNHGLALADGDAVVFLDADDLLAPDTLAANVAALEAAPARSVAAGPWHYLVPDDAGWSTAPHDHRFGPDPLADWLVGRWDISGALLWPTALVRELGGWDESLSQFQDTDLALRAFVRGVRRVPSRGQGHACYRQHGSGTMSISRSRSHDAVRSRMRVFERVHDELAAAGRLEPYRVALARNFHAIARLFWSEHPDLARASHERAQALAGWRAVAGTRAHVVATTLLGLEQKERLAAALARLGLARSWRRTRRPSPP